MKRLFPLILILVCAASHAENAQIDWKPWSDDLFAKAQAEHKLVLLDLGAVWCHWCHVMDEITYKDPQVIELLRSNFIAVRVDQDARPELANRYEDYGWPATIIFKWDGSELAKRRGYLPPKPMASMLQAFVDDPTPGPSVTAETQPTIPASAALTPEQRAKMRERFIGFYDSKQGGWGHIHKYLNWEALEYCIVEGLDGDAQLEGMARQTLTAGLKLIDPVWGGVYQYSTDDDWEHAHFEKIMPFQAENLRVYSQAYLAYGDPHYKEAAEKIRTYLKTFLTSPEGAFYTSQDADVVQGEHSGEYFKSDDAARRKQGIPRIDTHVYARENGLAITGLTAFYAATGDAASLDDARRAAEWILTHRALANGGFRHDEKDAGGPYLADTLNMGRAFLQLYAVTAERAWLERADRAAEFINATFKLNAGFGSSASAAAGLAPKPQYDENVSLARWANLLARYTGKAQFKELALHAMRYAAAPELIAERGSNISATLQADSELLAEPLHVSVVGASAEPAAQALFAAALRSPRSYKLTLWQRAGETLPGSEAALPAMAKPAAFLCAEGRCSAPIYGVEALGAKVGKKKVRVIQN